MAQSKRKQPHGVAAINKLKFEVAFVTVSSDIIKQTAM